MKNLLKICFVLFALSLPAHAVTVEVLGQRGEQLLKQNLDATLPTNAGEVTIAIFDQYKVPYVGSTAGIAEIYNLKQEIRFVSDTEMKAYGWCFSIDGVVVDTMPDQTLVSTNDSVIQWYYAYAHYKDGQWIGQCVKANDYETSRVWPAHSERVGQTSNQL